MPPPPLQSGQPGQGVRIRAILQLGKALSQDEILHRRLWSLIVRISERHSNEPTPGSTLVGKLVPRVILFTCILLYIHTVRSMPLMHERMCVYTLLYA